MFGSILLIGMLICSLLHCAYDLKVAQINVLGYIVVGLKEMNSGVHFPNCHNRQLQKPGLSSSPSTSYTASFHSFALSDH